MTPLPWTDRSDTDCLLAGENRATWCKFFTIATILDTRGKRAGFFRSLMWFAEPGTDRRPIVAEDDDWPIIC